jgi:hypothetical protein
MLVAPIVSNPTLTESGWDNVFRFTNRDDATAAAIANYLTTHFHKRNAVIVETDTVSGRSVSKEFNPEDRSQHLSEEGVEQRRTFALNGGELTWKNPTLTMVYAGRFADAFKDAAGVSLKCGLKLQRSAVSYPLSSRCDCTTAPMRRIIRSGSSDVTGCRRST